MPKVKYDGIVFDSQLEVDYYKYLKENATYFVYHPKITVSQKDFMINFLKQFYENEE